MQPSEGLTITDAQKSICAGTYGGKSYSKEEQQAACQRVESGQMPPSRTDDSLFIYALATILITAIVLVLLFIKRKSNSKRK